SVVGSAGDNGAPTMLARQPLGGRDASAALNTMMASLHGQRAAPQNVYLVGASSNLTGVADQLRDASTLRVEIPEDPTFALARGAAMAAGPATTTQTPALAGDATAMVPVTAL